MRHSAVIPSWDTEFGEDLHEKGFVERYHDAEGAEPTLLESETKKGLPWKNIGLIGGGLLFLSVIIWYFQSW